VAALVEVDSNREVFAGQTETRADVADSREIGALVGL
jgi:hypothetical protein